VNTNEVVTPAPTYISIGDEDSMPPPATWEMNTVRHENGSWPAPSKEEADAWKWRCEREKVICFHAPSRVSLPTCCDKTALHVHKLYVEYYHDYSSI
jgi:hypothetical protein